MARPAASRRRARSGGHPALPLTLACAYLPYDTHSPSAHPGRRLAARRIYLTRARMLVGSRKDTMVASKKISYADAVHQAIGSDTQDKSISKGATVAACARAPPHPVTVCAHLEPGTDCEPSILFGRRRIRKYLDSKYDMKNKNSITNVLKNGVESGTFFSPKRCTYRIKKGGKKAAKNDSGSDSDE